MAAKYILAVLACTFVGLGVVRLSRGDRQRNAQARVWLLIGAIFAGVSAWLWYWS